MLKTNKQADADTCSARSLLCLQRIYRWPLKKQRAKGSGGLTPLHLLVHGNISLQSCYSTLLWVVFIWGELRLGRPGSPYRGMASSSKAMGILQNKGPGRLPCSVETSFNRP